MDGGKGSSIADPPVETFYVRSLGSYAYSTFRTFVSLEASTTYEFVRSLLLLGSEVPGSPAGRMRKKCYRTSG